MRATGKNPLRSCLALGLSLSGVRESFPGHVSGLLCYGTSAPRCGTRSPAGFSLLCRVPPSLPRFVAGWGTAEGAASEAAAGYLYFMKTGLSLLAKWLLRAAPASARGSVRSRAGDFPLLAALPLFLFLAKRAVCTADALFITLLQRVVTQPRRNLCATAAF